MEKKNNFIRLNINLFSNHFSFYVFFCLCMCLCVCVRFLLLLTDLSFILILLVCVSLCSMPYHQHLATDAKYNVYGPCTNYHLSRHVLHVSH
jgi:hypothetical protein